jgi:hypothetical protein
MQYDIRDLRMNLMIINEFREDRRKEDNTFMGVNEVAFTRVL